MTKFKSQNLIPIQKMTDKKLQWQGVRTKSEEPFKDEQSGIIYTHGMASRIVDTDGTIYDGIIEEDGSVTTDGGYGHFDSVKTCEAFGAAEDFGMSKRYGPRGRTRHHLYYNRETGEVFGRASLPSGDERIYAMNACDVAAWLSDIDNRWEPITYDSDPRAIVIGVPIEIFNTIERRLPGIAIDWIRCILAEALGDIALAGPPVGKPKEGDPAFTAEQVREALDRIKTEEATPTPDQRAPRTAEQIREVIDRIKAGIAENEKANSIER
jgi:hypothetical protein